MQLKFLVIALCIATGADAFTTSGMKGLPALRRAPATCRRHCTASLKMQQSEAPKKDEEAKTEEKKEDAVSGTMTKVKDAGVAGLISYALWEFAFWTISAPAAIVIYHQTTGEWPSFDNPESTAKVSAVIFGFLNFARALVPVRIGLTLATAPLVDKYIVKPFNLNKKKEADQEA